MRPHKVIRYDVMWCESHVIWRYTILCDSIWYDMAYHFMVECGVMRCDVMWCTSIWFWGGGAAAICLVKPFCDHAELQKTSRLPITCAHRTRARAHTPVLSFIRWVALTLPEFCRVLCLRISSCVRPESELYRGWRTDRLSVPQQQSWHTGYYVLSR